MNCDKAKGGLKVGFCHIGTRGQGQEDVNSTVHPNVLKGVGVLRSVVIKMLAPSGAPFRIIYFLSHAEGVTLEMGRGGEEKGPPTNGTISPWLGFMRPPRGAALQISSHDRPGVFPEQYTQYLCQSLMC